MTGESECFLVLCFKSLAHAAFLDLVDTSFVNGCCL